MEQKIIAWLEKYDIENYTLVSEQGLAVDVAGDVELFGKDLEEIPIQFNHIEGSFDCSGNNLKSLKGCPRVVEILFNCSHNQLTSLEYCPTTIFGHFDCDRNMLKSLEYGPTGMRGFYSCNNNQLETLEYATGVECNTFYASSNSLKTLLYLPLAKIIHIDNNPFLGKYQKITDCKKLKKVQKIEMEKQLLLGAVTTNTTRKVGKL